MTQKAFYSKKQTIKEESPLNKSDLRKKYLSKVARLSPEEKKKASERAVLFLIESYSSLSLIASFSPLQSELDITPFNKLMAQGGKLTLPRIENKGLTFYRVTDLSSQLMLSQKKIFEPDPKKCQPILPSDLSLLILPGLAFDLNHIRLGYGGGFYDRFLEKNSPIQTVGIAFKVQTSQQPLPREEHDHAVDRVFGF